MNESDDADSLMRAVAAAPPLRAPRPVAASGAAIPPTGDDKPAQARDDVAALAETPGHDRDATSRPVEPRMHRFTLAFSDPELEHLYRRTRSYRFREFVTGTGILAFVWLLFDGVIALVSPPTFPGAMLVTLGVLLPLFALAIVAVWLAPATKRPRWIAFANPALAFAAGLAMIAIQLLSDDDAITRSDGTSAAIYLLILCTFIRTRYVNKLISASGVLVIWELARVPARPFWFARDVADALLATCGLLVGLRVAYTAEAQSRRLFLQRRATEMERERAERLEREAHTAEKRLLESELRRQVAERSRDLSEAIARLRDGPTAAPSLGTGDVVDARYRIVRPIGVGGMGRVHEVARVSDGCRFALKVMTGIADPRALARFAREAQLAAELDHPNVVPAIDVGVTAAGTLFLVMPLVAGRSLDRARDRYGDVAWARSIVAQIADALVAMHARGIVHRDLKPSNVLLDGDRVKVTDFGIASVMAGAPGDVTPDGDTALAPAAPLTRTGHFVGTPLYMAPELADGAREATPTADIFSLGVIAYELFSKQLPFTAPMIYERLAGRTPDPPPPLATLAPEISRELAALVERCVAFPPDGRPSARDIAAAFQRAAA